MIWFFATMFVMYRGFSLYNAHGVPMIPKDRWLIFWPWWNWKYMTSAFVWSVIKLSALHVAITAACLYLAVLVL